MDILRKKAIKIVGLFILIVGFAVKGKAWETEYGYVNGGGSRSIKIDNDNQAHLAHREYNGTSAYLIRYKKKIGGVWGPKEDVVTNPVGSVSLAIDTANDPHFAYSVSGAVNYRKKTADVWESTKIVDDVTSSYVSLLLTHSGMPRMAYYTNASQDLKFAEWTGTAWSTQTIDSAGDVGKFASLVLNSTDNPSIAYFDASNSDLKFASWDGVSWSTQTIDSAGAVGSICSLALTSSGQPWVSYIDSSAGVKVAHWDGSTWVSEKLNEKGKGFDASIAMGMGNIPTVIFGISRGSYGEVWAAELRDSRWKYTLIDSNAAAGFVGNANATSGPNGIVQAAYGGSQIMSICRQVPLTKPGTPVVSSATPSSVIWTWSETSDYEDGFRLRRGSDNSDISGPLPPETTSWVQTGLAPNEKVQTYVEVFRGDHSILSNLSSNYFSLSMAPSHLSFSKILAMSANVSWDTNGNAPEGSYSVEKSNDGINFLVVFSTPTPPGLISGLLPETTAYFRVRFQNPKSVPSAYSETVSLRTYPAPATLVKADFVSTHSITWTWSDNAKSEIGFRVRRSQDKSDLSGFLPPGTTSWVQTGMKMNQSEKVYIQTLTEWGAIDSVDSPLTFTLVNMPLDFRSSGTYSNSVDLVWDSNGNPSGTFVQIEKSQNNVSFLFAGGSGESSFRADGLLPNTTYYFRIRAQNGNGILTGYAPGSVKVYTHPGTITTESSWATNSFPTSANSTSMVLDRSGKPRVCIGLTTGLRCYRWDGTTWNPVKVSGTETLNITQAIVALDSDQNEHIAFTSGGDVYYARPIGTDLWSIEKIVQRQGGDGARNLDLKLDLGGQAHIVFEFNNVVSSTSYDEIQYARWDGSVWTVEKVRSSSSNEYVSLALTRAGEPVICDGNYSVYFSQKKSGHWISSFVSSAYEASPSLVLESNDNPIICFVRRNSASNGELVLARWNSETWDIQSVTPSEPTFMDSRHLSLTLDSFGFPHIVYVVSYFYNQTGYARWGGTSWTIENLPIYAQSSAPELQILLDSNDRPRICSLGNYLQRASEPPSSLTGVAISTSLIQWAWQDNAFDEEGYRVRNKDTDLPLSANLISNATSWIQTGLTPNAPQSAVVEAFNPGGGAKSLPSIPFYTLANPPVGSDLTLVETHKVSLVWSRNQNPFGTFYQVEKSLDGISFTPVITTSGTALTVGGLTEKTRYDFRVKALNGNNIPTDYDILLTTVTLPPAPEAPRSLFGLGITPNSIQWSWIDVSEVEFGYRVINATSSALLADGLPINTTSWIQTGLTANTPHRIKVEIFNPQGIGSIVSPIVYTLPKTPTNTIIQSTSTTSVTISWEDNENPSGTTYWVERGSKNGPFLHIATTTLNRFVASGLESATEYGFRVRARSFDGGLTPFDRTVKALTGSPLELSISIDPLMDKLITYAIPPGLVQLSLPAGSFPEKTTVTIRNLTPLPVGRSNQDMRPTGVGVSLSFTPYQKPAQPAFLEIPYRTSDIGEMDPKHLVIARFSNGLWIPLPTTLDAEQGRVKTMAVGPYLYQIMELSPGNRVSEVIIAPNPVFPEKGDSHLEFSKLPVEAKIVIFTVRGQRVKELTADLGGLAHWDLRNEDGENVASGIYFIRIDGSGGDKILKVAVQR